MTKIPIKYDTNQSPTNTLELLVSRSDAYSKIGNRIEKGKELLNRQIISWDQLETNRKDYYKWSDYNAELLNRIFGNYSISEEYSSFIGVVFAGGQPNLPEDVKDLHKDIDEKIHRLDSIKERLELIPESQSVSLIKISSDNTPPPLIGKAFIVHGHDEGARESVARFLEKLGIEAIILHEQASAGRTIIEKLEYYSDVDYAVVVLSPDDVGASASTQKKLNQRARQNVILELGYFVAKLSRSRVCALHKGEVELPTDILGVVYIPLDTAGAWRVLLARELRTAGFSVDLNTAM